MTTSHVYFLVMPLITIIIVMWMANEHTKQINRILERYKDDINTVREMYVKNVSLVKKYETMADDQQDVMMLVTTKLTAVTERLYQILEEVRKCGKNVSK